MLSQSQACFTVAALRLDGSFTGQHRPSFKPQELCTLLRAAQADIAQPWTFLGKLADVVVAMPFVFESWSTSERAELHRALALLNMYRTTLVLQELQVQQRQQQMLMISQQQYDVGLHSLLSEQLSGLSLGSPAPSLHQRLPPQMLRHQKLNHSSPGLINQMPSTSILASPGPMRFHPSRFDA